MKVAVEHHAIWIKGHFPGHFYRSLQLRSAGHQRSTKNGDGMNSWNGLNNKCGMINENSRLIGRMPSPHKIVHSECTHMYGLIYCNLTTNNKKIEQKYLIIITILITPKNDFFRSSLLMVIFIDSQIRWLF